MVSLLLKATSLSPPFSRTMPFLSFYHIHILLFDMIFFEATRTK
jgi:hypothetical protein